MLSGRVGWIERGGLVVGIGGFLEGCAGLDEEGDDGDGF